MRKLVLALSAFMILVPAVCVSAATLYSDLTYLPTEAYVTAAPGEGAQVRMGVTMDKIGTTQMVRFLGSVEGGNLPASWVASSSYYQFISKWSPVAYTTLTISIPDGTPPGVYSGFMYSWAGFKPIGMGNGMYLEVTVEASCADVAHIDLISMSPEVLWPPDHGMVDVMIEGLVDNPEGCTLYEALYEIDDEYGVYTGSGTLSIDASGYFSVPVPVEASRLGTDKDGRTYTMTIHTTNDAGDVSLGPLEVVVPHDMRDKNR